VKNTFRSSLIFKSGIAATDQALISLVNFTVSFFLIRYSSRLDFGYYSIGFPITLFFVAVQNAIINTPLAVLLATKNGKAKIKYSASLFYGQFILILPAVCVAFLIILALHFWGLEKNKAFVAAAISFASIGILFKEFFKAYFFAIEIPVQSLKLNAIHTILYMGVIAGVFYFWVLSAPKIFIAMGLSSLAAGLYFKSRLNWQCRHLAIKDSYISNWKYGKWALLGVFVTHVQNYSYIYLLGVLLGSYAVADVSAARFLLMPLALIPAGWVKVIIPYGSRLREERKLYRFFKEQMISSLIFVAGVTIYTTILFYASDILQTYVLSEKYTDSFNYLVLWGVYFAVGFIGLNASFGLQVTKRFDIISKINLFTMLLTVACAYFFIQSHGIRGGLTALIIGQIVLSFALWIYFAREIFFNNKVDSKIGASEGWAG
jgi:O-antigen/teichoic acid export membrane protein